jgi:molybdate transport system ATP-binding protein
MGMIEINISKKLLGSNGDMNLEVKLNIDQKEFIALTGSSGAGKTTLLRILAGLEEAKGTIKVGDEIWLDSNYSLPPQKRKIGFVFQEYALFNNMSVEQNLTYIKKDIKLARELLEITGLVSLKDRLPSSLSGGQKQRVALCRAMMNRPKILLMDEPLSALDQSTRVKLQDKILAIHREFGTITIMVSHDISEIYRLSSRVITLDQGRIIDDTNIKDIVSTTDSGSKFIFEGSILDIDIRDSTYIVKVVVAKQVVTIFVDKNRAKSLIVGQKVTLTTDTFRPYLL